ncbi:replication protein A 70 kDa DNA-binding subunit [Trifolium pratense]|uniref:Replication protein A 70 kDa DNA-binding subunit n=1 Tax=Trifolium pratense TaxID=57577 RepID=A0A2K3LVU1_TRIPR|nr:replication protein A 70 kDa DNA-binding subunit [Trifolium pratense]
MDMVAKQAWNIVQNPNSLVSRVIKARWSIGSGDKINIMKDSWLRGSPAANLIINTLLIASVHDDKIVGMKKEMVATPLNPAPYKAQYLLWRLCRGCLPTRANLYQRRVNCDVHCPICEYAAEDDLHVFFDCSATRECWQAAGLLSVLENNVYQQDLAADRVFAMCRNED